MRLTTFLLACIAATPMMASCGGEPQVLQAGDVRTFAGGPSSGSDDAEVSGTLVLTPAGCIALDQGGGLVYVVVWPHGTELSDDGAIEAAGRRFAIGDRVDAGGGYATLPLGDDLPDIPAECFDGADDDEVAVIYQASTIQ